MASDDEWWERGESGQERERGLVEGWTMWLNGQGVDLEANLGSNGPILDTMAIWRCHWEVSLSVHHKWTYGDGFEGAAGVAPIPHLLMHAHVAQV